MIQGSTVPKFFLVLKTVLTNLIIFAHNLLIAVIVLVVAAGDLGHDPSCYTSLHSDLAERAVVRNALQSPMRPLSRSLSHPSGHHACAVFCDAHHLVSCLSGTGESPRRLFVALNPLAHYVEIWRETSHGRGT